MRFQEWPGPDPHTNFVFVWLFCHQLGVLHHRRTLARLAAYLLVAIVVAVVGVLWLMVDPGPWYPTNIGVGDSPVSNLMPPTSACSASRTSRGSPSAPGP